MARYRIRGEAPVVIVDAKGVVHRYEKGDEFTFQFTDEEHAQLVRGKNVEVVVEKKAPAKKKAKA